jgi:hypothetical protein
MASLHLSPGGDALAARVPLFRRALLLMPQFCAVRMLYLTRTAHDALLFLASVRDM